MGPTSANCENMINIVGVRTQARTANIVVTPFSEPGTNIVRWAYGAPWAQRAPWAHGAPWAQRGPWAHGAPWAQRAPWAHGPKGSHGPMVPWAPMGLRIANFKIIIAGSIANCGAANSFIDCRSKQFLLHLAGKGIDCAARWPAEGRRIVILLLGQYLQSLVLASGIPCVLVLLNFNTSL